MVKLEFLGNSVNYIEQLGVEFVPRCKELGVTFCLKKKQNWLK